MSGTLLCSVHGIREHSLPDGSRKLDYWISDGIYGVLTRLRFRACIQHCGGQLLLLSITRTKRSLCSAAADVQAAHCAKWYHGPAGTRDDAMHAGNLNGIYYDRLQPVPVPIRVGQTDGAPDPPPPLVASSLFGPTWCEMHANPPTQAELFLHVMVHLLPVNLAPIRSWEVMAGSGWQA